MTLIIVARSKMATFANLRELFAGEPDVQVIWDRRANDHPTESQGAEALAAERRKVHDPFGGRDFIVVRTADCPSVPQLP